jgi:hypothetical protein
MFVRIQVAEVIRGVTYEVSNFQVQEERAGAFLEQDSWLLTPAGAFAVANHCRHCGWPRIKACSLEHDWPAVHTAKIVLWAYIPSNPLAQSNLHRSPLLTEVRCHEARDRL